MKPIDLTDIGINMEGIKTRLERDINTLPKGEWTKIKKTSGIAPAHFSNVFSGNEFPSFRMVVKLAYMFGKSTDYYLYGKQELESVCLKIPRISLMLNKENNMSIINNEYLYIDKNLICSEKNLYCIRIEGNMMHPTLSENDIAIIDCLNPLVKEGKIHVFYNLKLPIIQIKRFCVIYDKIKIVSDNREFSPCITEFDKIKIIGHIVKILKSS